jgi:carbon-monoxide dehydrogenase small subunit
MLIMAQDILRRLPRPDAQTVRHELSGHICRCTGYANIVRAIVAAGEDLVRVDRAPAEPPLPNPDSESLG